MNRDLLSIAQSVALDMQKDGIVEKFINETQENQTKIATAYAVAAVEKFHRFTTKYMTNPAAKKAFDQTVIQMIVNKG